MTAGSGLLHKEMHSDAFTRRGGRFHALQLWVNLPAKSKMTPPRYQTLLRSDIPTVDGVRVIAGEFRGVKGPAQTFTPVSLFLARVNGQLRLELRDGSSTGLYIVSGKVNVHGEAANEGELVVLDRAGDAVDIAGDATVFVMSGEPINEPVAGYGPFVMNTTREIQQAFADFHAGRLGTIPTTEKTS
jgi:redox-sensitive bicupin YhaK (pirin superfamily)